MAVLDIPQCLRKATAWPKRVHATAFVCALLLSAGLYFGFGELRYEASAIVRLKTVALYHPEALRGHPLTSNEAHRYIVEASWRWPESHSTNWRIIAFGRDELRCSVRGFDRVRIAKQASDLARFLVWNFENQGEGSFNGILWKEALARERDPNKRRELQAKLAEWERLSDLENLRHIELELVSAASTAPEQDSAHVHLRQ